MFLRRIFQCLTSDAPEPLAAQEADHDLEPRYLLLTTIDEEVNRQLSSHAETASALTTRTTLLISTAVIFVSLPTTEDSNTLAHILSSLFALIGAGLGLWSLYRKQYGKEADLEALETALWNEDGLHALRSITHKKREILKEDRERLKARNALTKLGFTSLGVSILIAFLSTLPGAAPSNDQEQPTQTHTQTITTPSDSPR